MLKSLLVVCFCVALIGCSNDAEPTYPFRIAQESFIITHENLNDSLSIGTIERKDGHLGKPIVNHFEGFETGPIYVSYEPDGAVSIAMQGDASWISVPTHSGISATNPSQEFTDDQGIKHSTQTTSRCLRGADTVIPAMTVLSRVRTSTDKQGSVVDTRSWTDTLWWSQDMGLFEEISIHRFTPEITNYRWRCQSTTVRANPI